MCQVRATDVSLSWWAVILREMQELGLEVGPVHTALDGLELAPAIEAMSPTTAFWTTRLFGYAGLELLRLLSLFAGDD